MPAEYRRYIVCKTMGWTWQEYAAQPAWFIDQILAFSSVESDVANRQQQTTTSTTDSGNLHVRQPIPRGDEETSA